MALVTAYKLVEASGATRFNAAVAAEISNGYTIAGDLIATDDGRFVQPMAITTEQPLAAATAGAANGTGVTATEYGNSTIHRTVLTLDDVVMALTDVASTVAYTALKVYDFPAGAFLFLGATADLVITKDAAGVNDDWDGDFSLGTVTASNNNSLSSTEADLIPSTQTPQAQSGATTAKGQTTTALSSVIFDGTSVPKDAFLNILVDDGDQDTTATPTNLVVSGTITITWANLGDY